MTEQNQNQKEPAAVETAGYKEIKDLSFDNLFDVAVSAAAARESKVNALTAAGSDYEKIAVSAAVVKSVLSSYLTEIDEDGFKVPSYNGRVCLAEFVYKAASFENIMADLEEPVKPEELKEEDKKDTAKTAAYERAVSEYTLKRSDYEKLVKERAAGIYRYEGDIFILQSLPAVEDKTNVFVFNSILLDDGKFRKNHLSNDDGISTAARFLKTVGINTFIKSCIKAAGFDYDLSAAEKDFIFKFKGSSLNEKNLYASLKFSSEGEIRLTEEEREKNLKAFAKGIYEGLKSAGLTTAKKERVLPKILIELKKRF